MPRLLEEVQKIVRERGHLPQWVEDFIEPVEENEKSENVVEFEEESGDEGITDMENEDSSCLEKSDDEDEEDDGKFPLEIGNGEWEVRWWERKPGEKWPWGKEERKACEKEKTNGLWEDDEDEELGKEERMAGEKEKENKSGEEETRTNSGPSLKDAFVKIDGTVKYVCQMENCAKTVHRCSRKEHLRAKHHSFPPLECNDCSFKTFSRSVYDRHKKKIH